MNYIKIQSGYVSAVSYEHIQVSAVVDPDKLEKKLSSLIDKNLPTFDDFKWLKDICKNLVDNSCEAVYRITEENYEIRVKNIPLKEYRALLSDETVKKF